MQKRGITGLLIVAIVILVIAAAAYIIFKPQASENGQNQTENQTANGTNGPGPNPAQNKTIRDCAGFGEKFSIVFKDQYPAKCCPGLTEWNSGMDTRVAVGDKCYETGLLSGAPVGTCIICGNKRCDDLENICNCPQDCNGENSKYKTLEDYYANNFFIFGACAGEMPGMNASLCDLYKSSPTKALCLATGGEPTLGIPENNPCSCPESRIWNSTIGCTGGSNGCTIIGCSGEICYNSTEQVAIASACTFLPEYACYRNATCDLQSNGSCGWTMTSELENCIANAKQTG